jgi:hypothetical protein
MRAEHRNIQQWIKNKYSSSYEVCAEIDGQNKLPDRKRHWYQPDVLLKNSSDEIKYIIEVENDPMRKSIVGASILADASINELKQNTRPRLIFIVYTDQGIKQMQNFKDKIDVARSYFKSLADAEIFSEDEFKRIEM